jgi:hypothetical protein
MDAPKYYIAVFGDPRPPEKDTVESGIYHANVRFAPFSTHPGDFLLLYCTGSYTEYAMRVPGLGIVLETAGAEIQYRYLPLSEAASKYELDDKLAPTDKERFSNIRFSSHWLFEISRQSFLNIVADRKILWP